MGKSTPDCRDLYYRRAKEMGFRARSAFKLIHINEKYSIFEELKKRYQQKPLFVVDLCAAPGSWSQVISQQLQSFSSGSRLIAVDLQKIIPIPNVHIVQHDITQTCSLVPRIQQITTSKIGLIVCDGAPDVTGIHELDEVFQYDLVLSALKLCLCLLEDSGVFIMKIFKSQHSGLLVQQLRVLFDSVHLFKPESSRMASAEHFVIAKGFSANGLTAGDIDKGKASLETDDPIDHRVSFLVNGI